jgi:hypothetical protein
MATNVYDARAPLPDPGSSCIEPRSLTANTLSVPLSSIQYEILTQLATRVTDANGYAALHVRGHDVAEIDDAIEALHSAGFVNAFFVNQAAQPRFHPSSLTREGRRILDQHVRASGT